MTKERQQALSNLESMEHVLSECEQREGEAEAAFDAASLVLAEAHNRAVVARQQMSQAQAAFMEAFNLPLSTFAMLFADAKSTLAPVGDAA